MSAARARKETARFEPTGHKGIERNRATKILWFRETVFTDELRPVRVDRSLKTKQLSAAIDRAKRIRIKITKGDTTTGHHTMSECFDLVLEVEKANSERTFEQADSLIENHLRPWFQGNCPSLDEFVKDYEGAWAKYRITGASRIVPAHIKTDEQRLAWLKQNNRPRKLEHDRRYLVMALLRAFRRGWIRKEFEEDDFDLNEATDPIGKYIEDSDVKWLLAAAKGRIYLQILIAVETGMRVTEILNLSLEEIDEAKHEINLDPHRLKIRRPREVPIPVSDSTWKLLEKAIAESKSNGGLYIFAAQHHNMPGRPTDWKKPQNDNGYQWDKVRLEAAGLRARAANPEINAEEIEKIESMDVRFHDLRHTAITNLLASGIPEISVRKICGVSEKTMRRVYAHIQSAMKKQFKDAFAGRFSGGEK